MATSKDIPHWDGDHNTFEKYKEKVRWYIRRVQRKHQDTIGPSLASALTGEAERALEEISEEGIQLIFSDGGWQALLHFLEDSLLDLPIPEASKLLREYFFNFKRKLGESMKAYFQRARILTDKLEKAFLKIETKDKATHTFSAKARAGSRAASKAPSVDF